MLPEISDEPVYLNEELKNGRLNTETEDSFEVESKQSKSKSSLRDTNTLNDDQGVLTTNEKLDN